MDPLVTIESPDLSPAPPLVNVEQASIAPKILIFAITTLAVFGILFVAFRPKDAPSTDNTVGKVSRAQCQQTEGKIVPLESGHDGCKIGDAVFTLTD